MAFSSRDIDLSSNTHLEPVAAFLQQCHGGSYRPGVYDMGDVWWGWATFSYDHVRVWEQNDVIVGLAWLEPPTGIVMQVHPDLRGKTEMEADMIGWAIATCPGDELWSRAFGNDTATVNSLLANGFARSDDPGDHMVIFRRSVPRSLIVSAVPDGFTVQPVRPEDAAERVAAHRDAFAPSKFTPERYERTRSTPGYNPDLDMVVYAPDGTIAAYCLGWHDSVNNIGYYEPVGTREAYRGKGLGKAVLMATLREFQRLGAHDAVVVSFGKNAAAQALYRSFGGEVVDNEWFFVRHLKGANQ